MYLFFTKNGLDFLLGDFFTNSSDHPHDDLGNLTNLPIPPNLSYVWQEKKKKSRKKSRKKVAKKVAKKSREKKSRKKSRKKIAKKSRKRSRKIEMKLAANIV
jgi:hypothetical protein